jgi:hypothetical protein
VKSEGSVQREAREMRREANVYKKAYDWNTLIEAERDSTKRKMKRFDVQKHVKRRFGNLCEIQRGLIKKTIKTGEYTHIQKVSGQNKLRDIAKLAFHPNHIYHQALTLAGEERVEKSLIFDTYASRKGKGQIAGALRVKGWLKSHPEETVWYGQIDIRKYYHSITHEALEDSLRRIFKDRDYVSAVMEPVRKFGEQGLPLGIRPSQMLANLVLSGFDHWAKEEMGMRFYLRYMDDIVVLCKTKGEVWRFIRAAENRLKELKLNIHVPKVHRIKNGLYFLGYAFFPGGEMFWRRRNKAAWLKRRNKIKNPKRLREVDAAAWGMLKHGNKHCKRLYKNMAGIQLEKLGIKKENSYSRNGKKFFDVPRITASVVLNSQIDVLDWEKDIDTLHGEGRWILLIRFFGKKYKIVINSHRLKSFITLLEENRVTKFNTMLVDRSGNKHYDFDFDRTTALEIDGKEVDSNIIKQ